MNVLAREYASTGQTQIVILSIDAPTGTTGTVEIDGAFMLAPIVQFYTSIMSSSVPTDTDTSQGDGVGGWDTAAMALTAPENGGIITGAVNYGSDLTNWDGIATDMKVVCTSQSGGFDTNNVAGSQNIASGGLTYMEIHSPGNGLMAAVSATFGP